MDSIREWVLRIAGIIILISTCDMIMLEGEMKKYIKPVLGIILVITVVRPVFGDITEDFAVLCDYSPEVSEILIADTAARQRGDIKRLYEQRLSKEAQSFLLGKYGLKADIHVTAKDKTTDFGELESVEVFFENEKAMAMSNDLLAAIEENLGIGRDKIKIMTGEKREEVKNDAF